MNQISEMDDDLRPEYDFTQLTVVARGQGRKQPTRSIQLDSDAEQDLSQAKHGAVIPQTGKTRITIYIDDDVLETFRERSDAAGKGYQTIMNEALREYLNKVKQPLDEETLRRVIQEELRAVR
jgi:uncharacterized protein (DUF4415 family)